MLESISGEFASQAMEGGEEFEGERIVMESGAFCAEEGEAWQEKSASQNKIVMKEFQNALELVGEKKISKKEAEKALEENLARKSFQATLAICEV